MPLAPQTTPDLFTLIQREKLISPERLSEYLQEQPLTSMSSMPDIAARRLVKDGLLSEFQVQLLLLGQPDGLTMGRYQLTKLIGRGGMSSVFLANDTRLNRAVAVKIFTIDEDVDALQKRFEREARAAAAVDHPNVVKAFDYGDDDKQLYLVMEFVDGTDLHRLVKSSGPMPVELACFYARQAANGLHALHEAGLVHRDVKPSNFLASNEGTVKLCDLGIVRFLARDAEPITELHVAGSFIGTPQFLAPEQLEDSHKVDALVDVYGLGATLYFLLTGKPPRRTMLNSGQNFLTKPTAIQRRRPDLLPELAAYVDKMLADDPAERPKSAAEAARFLERFAVAPRKTTPLIADPTAETATNFSAPTKQKYNRKVVDKSSLGYRPVTESTPTLPCGTNLLPAMGTPKPNTMRWWSFALLLILCAIAAGFYFTRPNPTATLGEQVRLRIVTDKSMSGATIRVVQDAPGQMTLLGTVQTHLQKQKAITIAEGTAGVDQVNDELTIAK